MYVNLITDFKGSELSIFQYPTYCGAHIFLFLLVGEDLRFLTRKKKEEEKNERLEGIIYELSNSER